MRQSQRRSSNHRLELGAEGGRVSALSFPKRCRDCSARPRTQSTDSLTLARLLKPLDVEGSSRRLVYLDDDSTHFRIFAGCFKPRRHAAQEAGNDQLGLYADDALVGPGHPQVGDVCSAAFEDLLVGRLNVSMSADYDRRTPINIAAEGLLFGGRFCV